jgi:hydrogenase large subunit
MSTTPPPNYNPPPTSTTGVTVMVDPVTRIEGHLSIKINVNNGKVNNAWSSGHLFRGFEKILAGRDPRDAPTITSRICGVCHAVHRLTSILALENAANITPTPDAVRLRNIIQGSSFAYSHAAHLFVLNGPDYDLYGLVPGLSQGQNVDQYNAVLKNVVLPTQRLCNEIGAIFGGKTPHHMTSLPGGVTAKPSQAAKNAALARIYQIRTNLDKYMPAVLGYIEAHRSEIEPIGKGPGNFLAYGCFADPYDSKNPTKYLLKRGIYLNGTLQPVDTNQINEFVRYSWYTSTSSGNPATEPILQDQYGKTGAYSWLKAPRYNGNPVEVGPLAGMAVSGFHRKQGSVYDRISARAEEMILVLKNMQNWINDLTPDSQVYVPYSNPTSGFGIGLWEAPRGANGHWVEINNSVISRYQIVSPTNWNASPRDDAGRLGPIEQALIGAPVPDQTNPTNPMKIVRSFDPCLACSVH